MHPHPRFYGVADFYLKSKPPFYFSHADYADFRRRAHTSFVLTIRMVAQAKRARLRILNKLK